ncbi:DEP domain-containing protein 5 [Fasciola hepatica]|uniref:DEP domain-containing protein 5 n=1 Tax=Fasciola hepatica TaxID=6192 RepID=A0A4E0R8F8_FASHE|nr:DEP domain-containing protein 5 [Fasciola hepatica]
MHAEPYSEVLCCAYLLIALKLSGPLNATGKFIIMAVQKLKVQYHNRDSRGGFSDVLLSSRGGHGISVGDVIEVYHSEDVHHVLFLVTVLRDDIQTRDVISIESSLAQFFRLQQHKTACVRVVNKQSVSLDLVELHFREQYLSRSDCFRLSQELVGSVVQVAKKIEANDFRVQVGELWRGGEKYSCGYVGDKTKIVFRSSSASIHIFIQLSEEMWLFDDHGDLYFEKAIKFLSKLFLCFWPENYCSHDTNVIFFTRVYITGE